MDRRTFLRTSAAAIAASQLPLSIARTQPETAWMTTPPKRRRFELLERSRELAEMQVRAAQASEPKVYAVATMAPQTRFAMPKNGDLPAYVCTSTVCVDANGPDETVEVGEGSGIRTVIGSLQAGVAGELVEGSSNELLIPFRKLHVRASGDHFREASDLLLRGFRRELRRRYRRLRSLPEELPSEHNWLVLVVSLDSWKITATERAESYGFCEIDDPTHPFLDVRPLTGVTLDASLVLGSALVPTGGPPDDSVPHGARFLFEEGEEEPPPGTERETSTRSVASRLSSEMLPKRP